MITLNKSKRVLISLFFISASFSISGFAQDAKTVLESGGDLDVLYRNERNIGVMAHTDGVGVNYRRIRHITGTKKGILEIEVLNMHHPKEIKVQHPYLEGAGKYYYGKLNSFQIIRPGVGYQKVLYRRAERKSVEIRMGTFLGASLGFAKPVYLEIVYDGASPGDYVLKQEKYDPEKHFTDKIYDKAPFYKGLEETKIHPGGYAKLALSFEYGEHHDDVKAIETGVVVDAYPSVIPLMAHAKNQQVMLTFYVSLVYGKKWF